MPADLKVITLRLPGLLLLEPQTWRDERGFLRETYHRGAYAAAGITCDFVQDNHSHSSRNTLRGMHYQMEPGQAKLVWVPKGEIFDVAVDIRADSKTCGQWEGVRLAAATRQIFFIPAGYAHGFCVLSDEADVLYKLSSPYDPNTEAGFCWNDPEVGIEWPVVNPLLSSRDRDAPPFASIRTPVRG